MTTARTKRLTFDEWQALPETKQICEVVDGVLVMPPSPFGEHAWTIQVILGALRPFLSNSGMGLVLTAPYDVLIHRDPLRVRQPDILVVNAELTGIARPADLSRLPFLELPPLLVVEVLSPSNTPRDIEERLADYRSIGVRECWLASFETRTIEVLRLTLDTAETVATYRMAKCCAPRCCPASSWLSTTCSGRCWGRGRQEMKLYKLPIVLYEPSEDTEYKYMAEVPALPGCRVWGDSVGEALDYVRSMAEAFVDSYLDRELTLPEEVELLLYEPGGSVIHGEIIVTA